MTSLRDGIERAGFDTEPATSVRAVAEIFGLKPEISVQDMARLLAPQRVTWDLGPLTTDEHQYVTAWVKVELSSDGRWRMHGTIRDNGDEAGVTLTIACRFVDDAGIGLLFVEQTSLNESEEYTFDKEGRSLWLARNWDAVVRENCRWHLRASVDNTWEIIGLVLSAGLFALAGGAAYTCTENGSWRAEPNSDGSVTATCSLS